MKTVFIGGGQGCREVLEMAVQGRLRVLALDILAVVDVDPEAPGMVFARQQGWPTLERIEPALAIEGLELVIELTGSDAVAERIYQHLPSGVRMMDHVMARVFWNLEQATVELQEILDTIPDVVLVLDPEEPRWVSASPASRALTATGLGTSSGWLRMPSSSRARLRRS